MCKNFQCKRIVVVTSSTGYFRAFSIILFFLITGALQQTNAQSAAEITSATEIKSGLCVRIGTVDGALESDLASEGTLLVHGLALSQEAMGRSRKTIADRKLSGLAQVERWLSGAPLPYPRNSVNLLITAGGSTPSLDELGAIVAPGGAIYTVSGSQVWKKPRPTEIDDWTHFYHDASNTYVSNDKQVGPPTGIQWMAGVRTQGSTPSNGLRFSNGKMAYEWAWRHEKTNVNNLLTVRDAFSGVHTWSQKYPERSKNMALIKTKPFIFTDRIYTFNARAGVPMVGYDAETGAVDRNYDKGVVYDGTATGDCIQSGTTLFQTYKHTMKAVDIGTGAVRWSFQVSTGKFLEYPTLLSDKGIVVVAQTTKERLIGRHPSSKVETLHALRINDGSKAWQSPSIEQYYGQMLYKDDMLCLFSKGQPFDIDGIKDRYDVGRVSTSNGSVMWHKTSADHTTMGGVNWLQEAAIVSGRLQMYAHRVRDLDLANGSELATQSFSGNLGRCTMSFPTANFVFSQGINAVDLSTFKPYRFKRIEITRASCGSGTYPANGMLYAQPNRCGCAPTLRGYIAMSPEPVPARLDDGARLEKGQVQVAAGSSTARLDNEWPAFMASSQREASVKAKLAGELRLQFKIQVTRQALTGGPIREDWQGTGNHITPLTQATVAAGRVFVAIPDENSVAAFDAATGDNQWRFVAGGRIDSPPSIVDGLCVFGSRDGWIYCLQATSGALVWRHFAAHTQRYIAVASQMESAWPVHGSLVVHKGKLIVTAGRHQETDGGIVVWILDLYKGTTIYTTTIGRQRGWHTSATALGGQKNGSDANVTKIREDLLAYDGRYAYGVGFVIDPEANVVYENSPRSADLSTGMQRLPAEFPSGTRTKYTHASPLFSTLMDDWSGPGSGAAQCWSLEIPTSGFNLQSRRLAYSDVAVVGVGPLSGGGMLAYWNRGASMSLAASAWRLAGESSPVNALIIAGDQVVTSSFSGKGTYLQPGRGSLQFYRTSNGTAARTNISLESAPIENGIASAYGRLYISCENGTLVCLGEKGTTLGTSVQRATVAPPGCELANGVFNVKGALAEDILVIDDLMGRELTRFSLKNGDNVLRPSSVAGARVYRMYRNGTLLLKDNLVQVRQSSTH